MADWTLLQMHAGTNGATAPGDVIEVESGAVRARVLLIRRGI